MPNDSNYINVLQLTDTHLFKAKGGKLLGLDTDHCLDKIVEHILEHEQPDLVLATGDLTHDASPAAYARFKNSMARLDVPVYCLPGNHDESKLLMNALNDGSIYSQKSLLTSNGWRILFLDTTIPGSEAGHLKQEELNFVEKSLSTETNHPVLICLHHPLAHIASEWLDSMAIDNGDELLTIAEQHQQVRAVICGHIHQELQTQHQNVQLLGTPSTCVQFLPRSKGFAVEEIPPGYRRLKLFDNGEMETDIVRLNEIPGEITMNEKGY
ncbi:MAG: 3',5'-cyclic-AMP phosphodiesterase [Gammaproteobacteria bacterium]